MYKNHIQNPLNSGIKVEKDTNNANEIKEEKNVIKMIQFYGNDQEDVEKEIIIDNRLRFDSDQYVNNIYAILNKENLNILSIENNYHYHFNIGEGDQNIVQEKNNNYDENKISNFTKRKNDEKIAAFRTYVTNICRSHAKVEYNIMVNHNEEII